MQGYRLATAEIIYRMPDHQNVLQSFIWQHLDLAPHYPVLTKFLKFWETNIEGPLVGVHIGRSAMITPQNWQNGIELQLH